MKDRDHYDWIVIGNEVGALTSAVLAARAGFSVLVVPESTGPEAQVLKVSQGEQVFDPEPNRIGGLIHCDKFKAPLHDLLTKVGVLEPDWEALSKSGSGYEFLSSELRLTQGLGVRDLFPALRRELDRPARELNGQLSVLRALEDSALQHWSRSFQKLSFHPTQAGKMTYAQWRLRWQKEVRRKRKDLTALLSWIQVSANGLEGQSSRGALSVSDFLQKFFLQGFESTFQGGQSAWRESLLRLARRLGADVAPRSEVKHIWTRNGRFFGIQLSAKGAVIEGRACSLGISLDSVRRKWVASGLPSFSRLRSPLQPDGWYFTQTLTVHREALPESIRDRVLWLEKDAPGLEIEIANPEHYGVNDPDYRVILLRTVMPFTSETLEEGYQRMTSARMVRKWAELFPFSEYHVVHLFPDFRVSQDQRKKLGLVAPAEFKEASKDPHTDFYARWDKLDQIPENLRVYSGRGLGVRSGIRHLFVVGPEAYPELGPFGRYWAAIEATQWLASKSGMSSVLASTKKE